jgi:ribulose-phosphate 3-epimerase
VEKFSCSALVNDMDPGRLEEEFRDAADAGIEALHFDIMDGSFVPRFSLGPDFVALAKRCSDLPCDVHLLADNPAAHIESFIKAGSDCITIPVETSTHAHMTLSRIREAGVSPGIAISPSTPLTKLDYLLPLVDRVVMLPYEPCRPMQEIVPTLFERVRILYENIRYHEYRLTIQVDGCLNVENGARLLHFGAREFVLDRHNLLRTPRTDLTQGLESFKQAVLLKKQIV